MPGTDKRIRWDSSTSYQRTNTGLCRAREECLVIRSWTRDEGSPTQPRQMFLQEQQPNIAGNQHPTACTASPSTRSILVQHFGPSQALQRIRWLLVRSAWRRRLTLTCVAAAESASIVFGSCSPKYTQCSFDSFAIPSIAHRSVTWASACCHDAHRESNSSETGCK
jgi:hypothetical protein